MKPITSLQQGRADWLEDRGRLANLGVSFEAGWEPYGYLPDNFRRNVDLAMDAAPTLSTVANAGIPAWMTTLVDPEVYNILFSPNAGALILGEVRKGTWVDQTAMFPTVEHTVEVSTYGDFNNNGRAGVNANWPQRQSYLFQTISEYGELELERAGAAKLNWISELDKAAALGLNKFLNLTYFFGVSGLQNYGLTNDPGLSAALTPALKAYGNNSWITSGVVTATATEIYNDILSLFIALVAQTGGNVKTDARMVLALGNSVSPALNQTNSFGLNVHDQLKKNFPNIRIETAVQYEVLSATNPQGIAAGNLVQLIVEDVEGQKTGYAAFNEKMRAHKIIPDVSSFKQKKTSGTWGAVIRQPFGIAQMLGV